MIEFYRGQSIHPDTIFFCICGIPKKRIHRLSPASQDFAQNDRDDDGSCKIIVPSVRY
jgi:hypothetical protein